MNKSDSVLILGSRGLVGSALCRRLLEKGYTNLLTPPREELDLLDQKSVDSFFREHQVQHVFMAAAKVGGIQANNTFRADFIFENLRIQSNVFRASFETQVEKLLFLGSSCIYPKNCPQPIKEEYLLSSPLEPTNEPYAIAKIAGLKVAENFRRQYGRNFYSVMPTNLYGEGDNFHPEHSHVIPGLITRMKKAMDEGADYFEIWGSGRPRREFLYVDDLADACIFVMESASDDLPYWINIGTGKDISIAELGQIIADKLGFKGELRFNPSYPDGTLRKVLDTSKINQLGWSPSVSLEDGIDRTIHYYLENVEKGMLRQV
jgi:GDP-L-fucose synthase